MAPGSEKAEQAVEDFALNHLASNSRSYSPATGRRGIPVVHSRSRSGKTTSISSAVLAASRTNPKVGLLYELKGGVGRTPLAEHLAATLSFRPSTLTIDLSLHDLRKGSSLWQLLLHRDDGPSRFSGLPSTFHNSDSWETARWELAEFVHQYTASIALSSVFLTSGGGSGPFTIEARKPRKPLIEQIKAPMSSTDAQRLSERLNAEDGPRRKLPPRP
ncbi:hypothetical protein [Streptomyces hirsutus]|uniref:hypothetical protein n=1 Tax=Streptomyces hirsutus TaxID=35620 RepID=UPI0033A4F343